MSTLLHLLLVSCFSCCCGAEYARLTSCEETTGAFDRTASRYMDEMDSMYLEYYPGQSMVDRTSYSEETNAEYQQLCEAANWAWTEITVAIYCQEELISDEAIDDAMNETDIFIRKGACFPRNKECDHYVQNPIDWGIDALELYSGFACTTQDINETYSSLISNKTIPLSVAESQSNFVDWSDQYSEAKRHRCQEAINSIFSNEKYELYRTDIELFQVFPVLVRKEHYAGGVGGMIRYETYCQATADGSRLDVFNGTMDCIGVGSNNHGKELTTVIENVAECFPSRNACRSYTAETWTLENMMNSEYSCTVRGKLEAGISKDKEGGGKAQPKESNVKDVEVGGSDDESNTEENNQHGQDDDMNQGKDVEDKNMLFGGITASGTSDDAIHEGKNHLNFMAFVVVAGLVILALTAFISNRLRIHSRAAASSIGGNAVTYHNREIMSTTLEMT